MHVFTGDEGYRALICGETSQSLGELFQNRANSIKGYLSDRASDFMGFVSERVNTIKQVSGIQRFEALRSKARHMFNEDIVHPFADLSQMRQAKPVMRRWMMAEPTLRKAFHKQTIAGYNDLYEDAEPGRVGELHYDYRRATNGMFIFDEEGEWTATTWCEDLLDGDEDLTFDQQADIQLTWEAALAHFARDMDPTDNET